jgi:dTDP-4-amino-4,6-dideoxy-D-galactose acyltransferase
MTDAELSELVERHPLWPHVPHEATPAQVARFAGSVLVGARRFGDRDGLVALHDSSWDAAKLGVRSGRIFVVLPPDSRRPEQVLTDALAAIDADGYRYLLTRVDANDMRTIQLLEQAGFILVDAILSQYLWTDHVAPAPPGPHTVRRATPADAERLAVLVDESFTMSRFHCDPWIGLDRAREIYRDWGRNIAKGLNDVNLVVEVDGAVAGFLSCKDIVESRSAFGYGYGRIELVAVDARARGRGCVQALTVRLVEESAVHDWRRLGIGTQISNVRAIRAYQRAGFVPGDGIVTLRRLI